MPVITEQVVRNVPIPPITRTFRPVRNGELLDMVRKVAGEHDLEISNGRFTLANNQQRMFATFDLVKRTIMDGIARFKVGVRNSCDKSILAGVCFGGQVCVCENLLFFSHEDEQFGIGGLVGHKHTPNIDSRLYDRLMGSFGQFGKVQAWQGKFMEALQGKRLRNKDAYTNIINAARAGAINETDILKVADIWKWQGSQPKEDRTIIGGRERIWHREFHPRTGYSLLNAYTEVHKTIQEKNPIQAVNRSMEMVKFLHKSLVPSVN